MTDYNVVWLIIGAAAGMLAGMGSMIGLFALGSGLRRHHAGSRRG